MIQVIKGGMNILSNMTPKQREAIEEDLTLNNPAYLQAKKYSKYGYTTVPPFLMFYDEFGKDLVLPRGYKIPFEHKVKEDTRVKVPTKYPKFKITLRDTQREAFEAWNETREDGMLVLATGKGKSILGTFLGYITRQKTLIVVQKNDLVDGWTKDIELCTGLTKKDIGLIKAQKFVIGEQYTLTTIQTLSKLDPLVLAQLYTTFGMVIVDECLVGDTLIALEDGGIKRIDSVVNGVNLVGGEVSNQFSRKAKICNVTTKHGVISGSYTHPTFILPKSKIKVGCKNSFTEDDLIETTLSEIKEGDLVPVLKQVPHTVKNNWTKNQLALVGTILADGHLDKIGHRVKVNVTKDVDWYRSIFNLGSKDFNVPFKENIDCRGNTTFSIIDKNFKSILESKFLLPRGKKSTSITISDEIIYAPLSSVKAFIEALFNCEGDLNITKKSARYNINLTSKQFTYELSHLLKKFGVLCSIQQLNRGMNNHSDLYRISIGGSDYNKFKSNFSLITRKTVDHMNKGGFNGYDVGKYRLVKVKDVECTNFEEEVYDFTTTSHTFIANGLLTHNCHHSTAKSYEVFKYFRSRYLIGLTATDNVSNGLRQVQYWMFGNVAYRSKESASDEDIMPYTVLVRNSDLKYDPPPVYVHKGREVDQEEYDYLRQQGYKPQRKPLDPQELKAVLRDPRFNHMVAEDILKEYKQGNSCIAFLHEKEHIRTLHDLVLKVGVPADKVQLYYGDSKESDAVMKEKAESGEVLVTIATFAKATEGTNIKRWNVGFLVTSINNEKNTIQAVGRIRRRMEGKSECRIYDYSHPNVVGLANHTKTRMKAYKATYAKVINPQQKSKGQVQRGWRP